MAYQPGNEAKITAPATISHTSLPSQTGPMVVDEHPSLVVGASEERVQHAHTEVEALQDEEPDPEQDIDDEPEISSVMVAS